ncbi:DUF1674 domain-containing protein [Altererythrobacter sp. ZODW24]|uniref:DUF1674 domain-containing protein n=1 Tax=Altererythrobacter sp. ZODW24 TaxID=2185142 RepID=UPI000DF7D506|nr:DUF1674 domain-containing protein [Altererythrobacter sp. ZODW24]
MTKRATERPENFVKPAHWSDKPAPEPKKPKPHTEAKDGDHEGGLSPTRYGDWVKDGIAIDF